jgi:hypothetical protein
VEDGYYRGRPQVSLCANFGDVGPCVRPIDFYRILAFAYLVESSYADRKLTRLIIENLGLFLVLQWWRI